MSQIKTKIISKLDQLPEPVLEKVFQFVNNLTATTEIDDDPFLKVIGTLSGEPLDSSEIDDNLYHTK